MTFTTAGTYSFGIGVANVTTDQYSSGLLVNNFALSSGSITNGSFGDGRFHRAGRRSAIRASSRRPAFGISPPNGTYQALISTASVPEPSSIVLLVTGGLGAAVVIRAQGEGDRDSPGRLTRIRARAGSHHPIIRTNPPVSSRG